VTDHPYLNKPADGSVTITEAGRARLDPLVTDTAGPVYAFTGELSPSMVAAAMARLSRRGDDMRVVLLDEFVDREGRDRALLERVITAYGDDSVQQLVGIQLVVEDASNLLTKQLEWGRLASYLEQSTRYIFFDRRDEHGRYRFYTPEGLSPALTQYYEQDMTAIFEQYSKIVRQLTDYVRQRDATPPQERDQAWQAATRAQACDAARPLLPVATKSTVGIYASAQAVDNLIMHLLASPLAEARATGQAIYDQVVQVIPEFLQRTMREDRGLATAAYRVNTREDVRRLAHELLDAPRPASDEAVHLVDFYPPEERELVIEMLYPHTNLSVRQIGAQVVTWDEERVNQVLRAYCGERLNRRHRPGRALETAHFEFDIVGDYGAFRDLQRHRMVDAFEWQDLTPEHGYEVPELVAEAGVEDDFRRCFTLSEDLYVRLCDNGHQAEAQYATLLGHRMRYRFLANLRELFHLIELRTSPQGHPGYRKICQEMHRLVAEVYPVTAAAMRFVNQDEDPALTRLATERATEFKLSQLG
jgi:thymidylate synthase ThyX